MISALVRRPSRVVAIVSSPSASAVKTTLLALFDELLAHDGYGSLNVEMRLLKRGQKEVILACGKQYRYVVDFMPRPDAADETSQRRPPVAGA